MGLISRFLAKFVGWRPKDLAESESAAPDPSKDLSPDLALDLALDSARDPSIAPSIDVGHDPSSDPPSEPAPDPSIALAKDPSPTLGEDAAKDSASVESTLLSALDSIPDPNSPLDPNESAFDFGQDPALDPLSTPLPFVPKEPLAPDIAVDASLAGLGSESKEAETVRPLEVGNADLERRLILESEGLLDEPTQIDLDSQEMEDKLLGDLDSFFQEEAAEKELFAGPSGVFDFGDPKLEAGGSTGSSLGDDEFASDSQKLEDETAEDDPSQWPPPPESESELGQVRELLMSRELSQLSYLSRVLTRPAQRAEFLSGVITEALLLRTRRDEKLNTVLAPTVEKIVTASVRRDPENLASQIFPAIGPAIRRSISETFVSKLQDLNSTLETSFSLRGLKWRLEALRVHKPFSEIVLLHTLLYHVEEIYLIHASTGLVLDHLISEESESGRDADMVAGMFTAIQDFVRDSFNVKQHEGLDTLRFGDRTIFLRRTNQVYLACVVRGNPPESLNKDLQEALELMVVDCAEELDAFNGDATAFKKCRIYFQDFLRAKYQDKPRKIPKFFWIIVLAILFFFLVFGFVSHYQTKNIQRRVAILEKQKIEREVSHQRSQKLDRQRFKEAMARLNAEPGLIVAQADEGLDGRWHVICLKDSLAVDPVYLLFDQLKLSPERVSLMVRPFISLDEPIVQRRVREVINPLPTVELAFDSDQGVLTMSGTAPMGWIIGARERAKAIPGVTMVTADRLIDPRSNEMERLVSAINGVKIHFPTDRDEPVPEDRPILIEAVDNLVALENLAQETQMSVTLVIYGHADSTGQDRRNFELSEKRTKAVAALLYARGSSLPIVNYGLGSEFSARGEGDRPKDDPESRRIELRVRLAQGGISLNEP
ncbi:MAG: OmpA family protein [Deltaproteobacteria bacterium]|jgi:OOP family OmpA-OmpF porin|nr:OmpA family protein [Deltaproteobacteria bacterium]